MKNTIKEYQGLSNVILQENDIFRNQSSVMQKEIKKIKARNHKLYNLVYGWYKKHQFQLAKNKVLKRKNKELKEKPPNNLNILMRNQVIV